MPPNRAIAHKNRAILLPESCGGHSREGVNVLRSYLLPISAGITRRHKVVDRHCPCDLATALGTCATTAIRGQPLSELPNPASVGENVEQAIYRA
jgi:hypothetical protein